MRKSALPVLSGVFDCTPIRPRVVSVRALARTRRVGSPAGRINQREGSSAWVCAVPASSRRMRTSPGRLCLPQPPGRTAGKTSHRFRKRTPPPRVGVACGQARQTQSRESIFGDNVGDSAPSRSKPGTPVPVCQVGLATKRGRPVEVRERVEMNATGPRGAGRRKAGLRQPPIRPPRAPELVGNGEGRLLRSRSRLHPSFRGRSYLVDPASSHMLVSKIKPCTSKYKLVPSETADGSLNQLWFIGSSLPTWITVVILELIHASKRRPCGRRAFIRNKTNPGSPRLRW